MDAMRGTRLSEHIPANTSSAVVKRPFNCPAGTTLFALESLLFHLETGTARGASRIAAVPKPGMALKSRSPKALSLQVRGRARCEERPALEPVPSFAAMLGTPQKAQAPGTPKTETTLNPVSPKP